MTIDTTRQERLVLMLTLGLRVHTQGTILMSNGRLQGLFKPPECPAGWLCKPLGGKRSLEETKWRRDDEGDIQDKQEKYNHFSRRFCLKTVSSCPICCCN